MRVVAMQWIRISAVTVQKIYIRSNAHTSRYTTEHYIILQNARHDIYTYICMCTCLFFCVCICVSSNKQFFIVHALYWPSPTACTCVRIWICALAQILVVCTLLYSNAFGEQTKKNNSHNRSSKESNFVFLLLFAFLQRFLIAFICFADIYDLWFYARVRCKKHL